MWALCVAVVSAGSNAALGAENDAVKIGVLGDMSGLYADIGGDSTVQAVKMAVEDFGGSVLGKPIEVISADSQYKPDISANIARGWYDSGVDVITDLPSSGMALAVMEISRNKKKIALVTGAGSSEITGKSCSPYAAQWTWDTYAMSAGTGATIAKRGGKDWFFITADYVFGQTLERDTASVVTTNGGKVLGSVKHPLNTADFSSLLLQAQSSGAKIVALANGGSDTTNSVKQAIEFGLPKAGIQMVALVAFISDIYSLGLKDAQGLMLTEAFYWDMNDDTRAWSKRFYERMKRMPSMTQAGAYSGTLHYLRAIKAVGSKDSDKVMAQMRATPINDFMTHNGSLRADGRVLRDMYLFQVKTPDESKGAWDLYKLIETIPAVKAFRPLEDGGCPLVK
ncbi:ABC transporter substrate-binding protein [Bradyrhizobium iriomotense]|nr:ABC transporter substrate-binding protein [Bradyrhizobium iriomotense]MBR0784725.1 ABC transporter substrate-binding protein [Bradyrhizobium iriomotense]